MWNTKRNGKYNAHKTEIDGIVFDSKAEAEMYLEVKTLEKRGEIKDLELQRVYDLQPAFWLDKKKIRAITYVADFVFYDNRQQKERVLDCKGFRTPEFRLKEKLFMHHYGKRIENKV